MFNQSLIKAHLYSFPCFALLHEKNFEKHKRLESQFQFSNEAALLKEKMIYSERALVSSNFTIPSIQNHFKFLCDLYINDFGDHLILLDIFLATDPNDVIRLHRIISAMVLDLSKSISSQYTSELYCYSAIIDAQEKSETPFFSCIDLNYLPSKVLDVTNINHFGLVFYGEVDALINLDLKSIGQDYRSLIINLIEFLAYELKCPIDIPQFESCNFSYSNVSHLSNDVEVGRFLNFIIDSNVEYNHLEAYYSSSNHTVQLMKELLLTIKYKPELDDLMLNALSEKLHTNLCNSAYDNFKCTNEKTILAVVIEQIGLLNLKRMATQESHRQYLTMDFIKDKFLTLRKPNLNVELEVYSLFDSIFQHVNDTNEVFIANNLQFAEVSERVVTNIIFSNDNPVSRSNYDLEKKLFRPEMECGAIYINDRGSSVRHAIASLAFSESIINKLASILNRN
ncbi:hypothetical protein EIJ81_00640 (plasmid) [Aliivibrio salmonicida]|uniref:hypothetical protein n=1 Tax=Aliivibrio salmonicida TaxID=40269 RepID=UPI000F6BD464|nr:hypothetical protein [Aliivibrio salmonicida]AZL83406.1 hypothetical protein EIJ81_00640 [Aliivibrio salmonicida]